MNKLWNIKYLVVLAAVAGIFTLPGSVSALDDDGDSVDTSVENAAPNEGDNNYDGTPDAYQNDAATITNPNDIASPGAYVTLEVNGDCEEGGDYICPPSPWQIDEFKAVDPATLPSQPDGKVFPLGLFSVELSCYEQEVPSFQSFSRFSSSSNCVETVHTEEGCEEIPIPANLRLIFDRVLDTTNWTTLKYDPITNSYVDYSANVTISNQVIGYLRTVVEWSIEDGGFGDADGIVNDRISDPIGPTVPAADKVADVPVVLASAPGKTLANTGVDSSIIVLFGFALIAGGAVLLPKQN